MHPETKRGATLNQGPKRQNVVTEVPSFAADTAAKTGTSRRTVERSVALAEKLDDQTQKAPAKVETSRIERFERFDGNPPWRGVFMRKKNFWKYFRKCYPRPLPYFLIRI